MLSIHDSPAIFVYFGVLAAVLGAVTGSFLNCAAWRIAHHESFIEGRSHCPVCGHELHVPDLFPILSWVFLGGRCRYCKTKISIRYPLTELFFAVMTMLCLWQFDLTAVCLRNFIFACCLFCLSLVDLESMIIPDGTLCVAALAYLAVFPFTGLSVRDLLWHIAAGLCFGAGILILSLIFDRILGKESMGGGDIKLLALSGLYLGFAAQLFALMLACVIGLLFALVRRKNDEDDGPQFPFGPSIAAASWIMLLYGTPLVSWYLGLMGI